jgi:hypothetical protein
MRTLLHATAILVLLVICLMFVPARRVTGERDRELTGRPSLDLPIAKSGAPKSFADWCRDDPVEAVATSMRKYRSSVDRYTCVIRRQERIDNKLRDPETIECEFRESPFSVRMHWLGATEGADTVLYVAGENQDNFLVVPANPTLKRTLRLLGRDYAKRRLDSSDAKSASRYPPDEFGIYIGTDRVYRAWKAAQERGALRTEYLGLSPVPELDGKPCHAVRRTCLTPEEEGLTQVTIQFDPDSLLQVGAVLMENDNLIGRYHFANVKLNVPIGVDRFSPDTLK